MSDRTPFAACITQARSDANMSLSQAARLIGCSKAHLWELEDGRAENPTIKTLCAISTTYGVPVAGLAERAGLAFGFCLTPAAAVTGE